ncbi:MAG TPA: isoprenylcysteine carboxylmethyltransferase family protein [Burkholderiaceae bacterium]|jgi:protein-S-isoprenylcysteine O-methyltransferase Ste14
MQFHIPEIFHLPLAIPFWLVFAWVWIPETLLARKSIGFASSAQDAGTYRVIAVANHAAMLAAFAVSAFSWTSMPHQFIAGVTGTVMLFIGGVLRRYCFRALGQYFTAAIKVTPDQPLIQHGPYRWIRHPSYTAGLLILAGIGVALGNCLSVAFLFLIPCYSYTVRVSAEERALLDTMGTPYRQYMERTKRFIPFLY